MGHPIKSVTVRSSFSTSHPSAWQFREGNGRTRDGRVVGDNSGDDTVDGADEISRDGGGGGVEWCKLGGQTAEEGGIERSSTGRGGIEGEGNVFAGGGCRSRGQRLTSGWPSTQVLKLSYYNSRKCNMLGFMMGDLFSR
jgi:hypothetical protein